MERLDQIFHHPLYQSLLRKIEEYEVHRPFCLHDLNHFLDTARIMWILNLEEKNEFEKEMIYATALLHDLGRAAQYEHEIPHELAGKEIALKILGDCGFLEEEIDWICYAISSHRKPIEGEGTESPKEELAFLLYRADKISRKCYACKAAKDCYWPMEKRNLTIEN